MMKVFDRTGGDDTVTARDLMDAMFTTFYTQ